LTNSTDQSSMALRIQFKTRMFMWKWQWSEFTEEFLCLNTVICYRDLSWYRLGDQNPSNSFIDWIRQVFGSKPGLRSVLWMAFCALILLTIVNYNPFPPVMLLSQFRKSLQCWV